MLDLPRFAILRYDNELDLWDVASTRPTFETAHTEFNRLKNKGIGGLYLVGLAFIFSPSTDNDPLT